MLFFCLLKSIYSLILNKHFVVTSLIILIVRTKVRLVLDEINRPELDLIDFALFLRPSKCATSFQYHFTLIKQICNA